MTKEKFVSTYKKYSPKKWIKFAFKYFSKETEKKDMALNNAFVWVLGILFATGMAGTIMHWPRPVIKWVTIAYMIILTILVGFLFAAIQANNFRIRKIAKELGCTLIEYNEYVDHWGKYIK